MELNRSQKINLIARYYRISPIEAADILRKAEQQGVAVGCIKAVQDYNSIMAVLSFYND